MDFFKKNLSPARFTSRGTMSDLNSELSALVEEMLTSEMFEKNLNPDGKMYFTDVSDSVATKASALLEREDFDVLETQLSILISAMPAQYGRLLWVSLLNVPGNLTLYKKLGVYLQKKYGKEEPDGTFSSVLRNAFGHKCTKLCLEKK